MVVPASSLVLGRAHDHWAKACYVSNFVGMPAYHIYNQARAIIIDNIGAGEKRPLQNIYKKRKFLFLPRPFLLCSLRHQSFRNVGPNLRLVENDRRCR